jgi:hypothetical protein
MSVDPLVKPPEMRYNDSDRVFWLAIRQALLLAVRAIEERHGLEHSHETRRERGRRADN